MKLLSFLKKQLLVLAVLVIAAPVFAVNPPDEGMWLPMFIKNYNYAQMQKMKPSAYIINTGRGGIAVEEDLAHALDDGIIAGAALDVYVKEPLPLSSPLMHLKHPERLVFSPHIAWYSREARARLAHEMAENIRKGF